LQVVRRTVIAALGLAVAVSACSQEEVVAPPSTLADVSATTDPASTQPAISSPSTTVAVREMPSFRVVEQIPSDEGEVIVILLDAGDHDDVDIENLMSHVVDEYGPAVAYVVDDEAAVALVLAGETSGAVLAEHYLARLEDGNRVVYMGPLAEFGWYLVGS